jgi:hypothetical protein
MLLASRLAGLFALEADYAAIVATTQSTALSMIAWRMATAHKNRLPAPAGPLEVFSGYRRGPESRPETSYAVGKRRGGRRDCDRRALNEAWPA